MKEEIQKYRIISIDGSRLYDFAINNKNFSIRDGSGEIDMSFFSSYFDNNLEIDAIRKSYKNHRDEFKEKSFIFDNSNSKYPATLAIISLTFNRTSKLYNKYDNCIYIKQDYPDILETTQLIDHVIIQDDELIAVQALNAKDKNDSQYEKVENPIDFSKYGLQDYFVYNEKTKKYYRTEKSLSELDNDSKVSLKDIRRELYVNGFYLDSVHYVRYKRSAGSGREGSCLFIAEPLYSDMMNWTNEGLNIDRDNVKDLASYEAYSALTLSNIIGKIKIKKNEILIVQDVESIFKKSVIGVSTYKKSDGKADLKANKIETKIVNKIWDGESLIDESLFISNEENCKNFRDIQLSKKGMMLLRNKYFKSCAFNTKLQQYFSDNNVKLEDLNGFTLAKDISEIKLIVTDSSVKYLKLCGINGKSSKKDFNKYCRIWLNAVSDIYGVVKTDKKTHYLGGKLVRTNYQLINTLGLNETQIKELLDDSITYLEAVRNDVSYMRHYMNSLKCTERMWIENFNDDYNARFDTDDTYDASYESAIVKKMLGITDRFAGTTFYLLFKENFRNSFKKSMRNGHIYIKGTYCTLFGNGAELLYASHHKDYKGEVIALKDNNVYTTAFEFGNDYLCARSPHITMGNLLGVTNVDNYYYSRYFNLSSEIICVNSINHNIQQRLNGCDFDSDTVLITDNELMIRAQKENINYFPVPAYDEDNNEIKSSSISYNNTLGDLAKMDLAISNNKIGQIVNLSQFLNSLYWDKFNMSDFSNRIKGKTIDELLKDPVNIELKDLYNDICKLAVLSGIEIDKAKRSFPVESQDIISDLEKRRRDYRDKYKLPSFYRFITHSKCSEKDKADYEMKTSMQFVDDVVNDQSYVHGILAKKHMIKKIVPTISIKGLLGPYVLTFGSNDSRAKINIVKDAKRVQKLLKSNYTKMQSELCTNKDMLIDSINTNINELFNYINEQVTNTHILSLLIDEIDQDQNDPVNRLITAGLCLKSDLFNSILKENCKSEERSEYILDDDGDTLIYGFKHKKIVLKNQEN